MFQELRNMRYRLTLYYTLVLVLFTSLFTSFVFYNIFYANGFILDRELKATSAQVSNLSILPELSNRPPDSGKKNLSNNGEIIDSLFKIILRDENMNITQASIQYKALLQNSQDLARQSWLNQQERWDTINLGETEYRIFSTPFHSNGDNGVVQTCCNLTMIHKFISNFNYLLLAISVIAIVLAALIGWCLAGRAMMPVKFAWQRQKEFIADVSHELRTPLTVIQSNLDVVIADHYGSIKDNITWLQNAYNETENMGKLINDLLLLARIDAHEIQLDFNEFDLSSMITELAFQFSPLFQGKNLKFSSNIESEVKMYGDAMRIKQLVNIFLENAYKYTPDGGFIHLKVSKLQNGIEILVRDSGIGIEETETENIFRRFYRVDRARSRKQGGTGLGLSIAAWIVEVHKGYIRVDSKPEEGSTFKVFFQNNEATQ